MAENQYIGARYVPKFFANPNGSSEWLGNVPYEPLTIVTYLGNSYTSKIPVPPGIGNPSLNPTYWALTGNFNEQLQTIQNNIKTIEEETQTNTENISTINNFINRYYLFIGDSYGNPTTGWITPLINMMNLQTTDYTISQQGGAGFVYAGQGKTFLNLLQDVEAVLLEKVTDIVLISAGNDSGENEADIFSAMNNFQVSAKQTCTKLKGIHLGLTLARKNPGNAKKYLQRIFSAFNGFSKCHYMSSSMCFAHSLSYLSSDGIHLTQDGYNNIAYGVYQYLNGNEFYNTNIVAQNTTASGRTCSTYMYGSTIKVLITGTFTEIPEGTPKLHIMQLSNSFLLGGADMIIGIGFIQSPSVSSTAGTITLENGNLFFGSLGGNLPKTATPINIYASFDVSAFEW